MIKMNAKEDDKNEKFFGKNIREISNHFFVTNSNEWLKLA